jgi:LysR family transcriptional regulator, low CO2-responsive transcriptional regulator
VEVGLGVALIQNIAIEREITAGTLRSIRLHGADDSRTYLIARRKRGNLPTAAAQFVALLRAGN